MATEIQPTNSGATIGRARAIVRVKVLAIVPAAVAPEHAQVVAEQVLPVGEPETAQVVGVLQDRARSRRRVPAGPAVPTRLAIAAFLLVQVHVGVPSAVAEAVATGIMLEQAAAEAARAWAAAPGTAAAAEPMAAAVAVVVAAVVVVVVAAAAAAAEGRRNKIMISKLNMMNPVKTFQITSTIVIVSLATAAFATAAEPKADASATPANQKQ